MTAEVLLAIVGVFLSLLFAYVPKFKPWYEALEQEKKQLWNLGLLLFTAVGIGVLAYFGFAKDFGIAVTFDRAGLVELIKAFGLGVIFNAGTYVSTKYIGKKAKG